MFVLDDKENKDPDKSVNETEIVEPVDEELLQVFGEDPSRSNKVDATIHPSFKPHWQFWVNSGLKKEEIENLTKKYEPEECFAAPSMNLEVRGTLSASAKKRDGHFEEGQKMLGSALTSLGAAMTMIINEPQEPPDRAVLMERLFEAGKLMAGLFHKQTTTRKVFIEPGVEKEIKEVLELTTTDKLLYGQELSAKIKEATAISKVAKAIKKQNQPNPKSQGTSKNWNNYQPRRQFNWAKKNSNTYGQGRPQQSFKSRKGHFHQHQKNYPAQQKSRKTTPTPK